MYRPERVTWIVRGEGLNKVIFAGPGPGEVGWARKGKTTMVVRSIVFAALLATFITGGSSVRSTNEPLAPCHTRVSAIDAQGHRLVTYTDESGDPYLAGTIGEVAAAFNADLEKVRLVAAQHGDITINETNSGTAGRTTLTCSGQSGSAAILVNAAALDLRSPSSAISRDLVVMHELGHALGLAHTAQPCALMHANDSDCARPELIRFTEGERRAIDALYAATSVTTSPGPSTKPDGRQTRWSFLLSWLRS